ncbi:MAG TPA: glycoside hydrolase family 3 C-terminal domain-containing protein [Verrucomicrobiae bacterium]|jgi:beta-glucosidase|nr:glycoside hydrolase family 3 C-terminal domain-containing protein [Verrucomicrobiae bacterium]
MKVRPTFFTLIVCAGMAPVLFAADRPLYLDPSQPREARVEDLLNRLTPEEKVSLVHADSYFTTAAIPRLGLPRRWLSDGPHGVREDIGPDSWKPAGHTDDFSTCMPAGIALAATWNPALAQQEGEAIGQEARKRGKQIMLGPSLNIMRTPLCGRNFEYMGEDPFLTSRMAVGYIRGVQSQGVSSCAKHFAANNQELDRFTVNVELDERALREIYLPAFKASVQEAGVLSVMAAYNKIRGRQCAQNDYLLNKILKGEWGFQGLVVSDWAATHDTREAALNGLDLEMGTQTNYEQFYLATSYLEGLRKGEFPMAGLDDKVRRNLRVMFATHMFDKGPEGSLNTVAHQTVSRHVAEEAIVLLKNDNNILPLDVSSIKSLAVIGENAVTLQAHGGDSSAIKALYEITPLQGILKRAGDHVNVTYSKGCGENCDDSTVEQAVRAARQADVAIVIAGLGHGRSTGETEGADRKDLKLPYNQDNLIAKVREANPRTIVVLVAGSPVEMDPWLATVPSVILSWYSGMEGGNAIARVLFGDVNPSGKLPCTFPKRLEDSPAHALRAYPGVNGTVQYKEGLLVGYRYFDTKNVEPLFPFGYGLSYTHFDYSNFDLVKNTPSEGPLVTVKFNIVNTGSRAGAEIAQVYVHQLQPSLPRPMKELKGFTKVFLLSGQRQTVSIPLDVGAFSYYDPDKGGWLAEKGGFEILVGSSSRDIRWKGDFELEQTTLAKPSF